MYDTHTVLMFLGTGAGVCVAAFLVFCLLAFAVDLVG